MIRLIEQRPMQSDEQDFTGVPQAESAAMPVGNAVKFFKAGHD